MALTIEQEQALLALLNEKKITLSELPAATGISEDDLMLIRQGILDKSVNSSVMKRHFTPASASLTESGITKLSNAINSDDDYIAATSKAVKTAHDLAIKASADVSSKSLSKSANLSDVSDVDAVLKNLGLTEQRFGYKNIHTYTEAGIYTFSVPDELRAGRKCWVEVFGAGGGGAAAKTTGVGLVIGPAGGGGGGYSGKMIDLTGVDSVVITVGTGGIGGVSTADVVPGVAGGSSSFGGYCSASGGASYIHSASEGGLGVGGDINSSLGHGDSCVTLVTTAAAQSTTFTPGSGGGIGGGAAITLGVTNTTGNSGPSGKSYGGGGAGCIATSLVKVTGGNGADGAVFIRW